MMTVVVLSNQLPLRVSDRNGRYFLLSPLVEICALITPLRVFTATMLLQLLSLCLTETTFAPVSSLL